MPFLPASALYVALSLVLVYNNCLAEGFTDAPLKGAMEAISYAHTRTGLPSPTTCHLPKLMLEVGRRHLSRAPKKSLRTTPVRLEKLHGVSQAAVQLYMVFVSLLVGVEGFLRWSDLMRIALECSIFTRTHVALFLVFSKTDVYRHGAWIYIASTGTILCPLTALEKLMRWAGIKSGSFLRVTQTTKKGSTLKDRVLGYTRYLELLRESLVLAGTPPQMANEFGTRCMRTGGASTAGEVGTSDRLMTKHGRWLSARVKDGYMQESLENLLAVTRNLGL